MRGRGWYGTPKPEPLNQGWLTMGRWYRAHYFDGMTAPLCNKASGGEQPWALEPATTELRCQQCSRVLLAKDWS